MATSAFIFGAFTISANAAIYDVFLSDTPKAEPLRLNVPDSIGTRPVRGILIYANSAGGNSLDEATNPELVAFAARMDFAVMGTRTWGYFDEPDDSEIEAFEASIVELANLSSRSELVNAPWMALGFSNGGQFSYGLAAKRPEKVIAFIVSKGENYSTYTPPEATRKVPGILVAGENDTLERKQSIAKLYNTNRALGALWAWVEEEGKGHERANADNIYLPFFYEAYRLRYPGNQSTVDGPITLNGLAPESGWLVDPTTAPTGFTDIFPYDVIGDDPNEDPLDYGWVLNEKVARIFRGFSSHNKATDQVFLITSPQDISQTITYTPRIKGSLQWTQIEAFVDNIPLGVVDLGETPSWTVDFAFGGMYTFYTIYSFADGSQRHSFLNRVLIDGPLPANKFEDWLYDNYAPEFQTPDAEPEANQRTQIERFAFALDEAPENYPSLLLGSTSLQFTQRSGLANSSIETIVETTDDLNAVEWNILQPSDPAYVLSGNTVTIDLSALGGDQHFGKVSLNYDSN